MALQDPQWQGLVSEFTESLATLHRLARQSQEFTEESLEQEHLGRTLGEHADTHLRTSERVRVYLVERIGEDTDAQRALAIAAAADLEAAHLLDGAAESPGSQPRCLPSSRRNSTPMASGPTS